VSEPEGRKGSNRVREKVNVGRIIVFFFLASAIYTSIIIIIIIIIMQEEIDQQCLGAEPRVKVVRHRIHGCEPDESYCPKACHHHLRRPRLTRHVAQGPESGQAWAQGRRTSETIFGTRRFRPQRPLCSAYLASTWRQPTMLRWCHGARCARCARCAVLDAGSDDRPTSCPPTAAFCAVVPRHATNVCQSKNSTVESWNTHQVKRQVDAEALDCSSTNSCE